MTIVQATPSLKRYGEPHKIEPVTSGEGWQVCAHDGVRVYRVLTQRWQHDPNQLRKMRSAAARADLEPRTEHFSVYVSRDAMIPCAACVEGGPPHYASPKCESGARNHCSCDRCF